MGRNRRGAKRPAEPGQCGWLHWRPFPLRRTPMTSSRKPVTLHRLRTMHGDAEKISMLTCYDATFARVLDDAGVDCLLVGDSLGMVLQGHPSTVPVTLEEMAYHM